MNADYEDYSLLFCPNCGSEFMQTEYDIHIKECFPNADELSYSLQCEICKESVKQDEEYEKYIDHLLMNHSVDEIEKKVRIQKALLAFGINKKPTNLSGQAPLSEHSIIQCKLCENLVVNVVEQKKKHIHNFHKGMFYEDYYGLFDNAFSFKSNTEFYICGKCGVYMENIYALTILHDHFIHANLMKNTSLSIPLLFCNKCNKKCDEEDHIHISFLHSNKKETELLTQFYKFTQKKKGTESECNRLPGYYDMYKNGESVVADLITIMDDHKISGYKIKDKGRDVYYFGKYINSNGIKAMDLINIWKMHASTNRKIPALVQSKYEQALKPYIFNYASILVDEKSHSYFNEPRTNSALLIQRLKREFDMLYDHVPFDFDSSFFIRADANFPQFIKMLIVGPRGTPYEHGLYEFDVYIPVDYPSRPPKIRFITTGGNQIQFNPNLLHNGRVCLSLIGGWTGLSNENWNPKSSNLAQVVIIIISTYFNDRVIESEPGYENCMNTVEGIYENEAYSNIIRLNNLQFAILDHIKNIKTDYVFGGLYQDYFGIKSIEILEDIKSWFIRAGNTCSKYEGLVRLHNKDWCDIICYDEDSYFNLLFKKFEELLLLIINKKLIKLI